MHAIGITESGRKKRYEVNKNGGIICGLEDLVSLELFDCEELRYLRCTHNHLTDLDLSACKELRELSFSVANKSLELELSGCKELEELVCSDDDFTELELSNFKKLKKIDAAKIIN